jgi:hypothetical protein
LRANISKAIEKDALSWTEPEAARFVPLETKAVQRPHSGLRSVSAVRMVRPRPFETTRKFALSGGAVGVCDGKMAERGGFEPPIPLRVCRISSAVRSTTLPPLRPYRSSDRTSGGGVIQKCRGPRKRVSWTVCGALEERARPACGCDDHRGKFGQGELGRANWAGRIRARHMVPARAPTQSPPFTAPPLGAPRRGRRACRD